MADVAMASQEPRPSAGYKSFKKKYRKMRIVFENKMQESEELVRQEERARDTVKRLAVENDRLLDMLHDINTSTAIPPEKRIDVSRPPVPDSTTVLDIDLDFETSKHAALKRLEDLLSEVPHMTYDIAKDSMPELVKDLEKPENGQYPTHFLTLDDVDNYLHEIDTRLDPDVRIPTLAPIAHPNLHTSPHPLLKNPSSSLSWLQKHKPQIFLNSHDHHDTHHDDNAGATGTDKEAGGRKPRGGKASERASGKARSGKRTSAIKAAAAADKGGDWDASMDEDAEFSTPVATKGGKRKRNADDDAGYRPKGSGGRPTKKKRKSELGAESTPSASRKSKKEAHPDDD